MDAICDALCRDNLQALSPSAWSTPARHFRQHRHRSRRQKCCLNGLEFKAVSPDTGGDVKVFALRRDGHVALALDEGSRPCWSTAWASGTSSPTRR